LIHVSYDRQLRNNDITVYIKYNYAQMFTIFLIIATNAHLMKF